MSAPLPCLYSLYHCQSQWQSLKVPRIYIFRRTCRLRSLEFATQEISLRPTTVRHDGGTWAGAQLCHPARGGRRAGQVQLTSTLAHALVGRAVSQGRGGGASGGVNGDLRRNSLPNRWPGSEHTGPSAARLRCARRRYLAGVVVYPAVCRGGLAAPQRTGCGRATSFLVAFLETGKGLSAPLIPAPHPPGALMSLPGLSGVGLGSLFI